jgi:undecaprenyl-diphosphatase
MPGDAAIAVWLRTYVGSFEWLTVFIASYVPYFVVCAAAALLIREPLGRMKIWRFASVALSVVVGRGLIASFFHQAWNRPRPFVTEAFQPLLALMPSPSFPSGHVTLLFGVSVALLMAGKKKEGWWLMGLSLAVGIARVAAGVHWPSDVLGGVVAGIAGAWGARLLVARFAPESLTPHSDIETPHDSAPDAVS